MPITIDVTEAGPIFTRGRARRILETWSREVTDEVSDLGVNLAHQRFAQVFKNPSGHYESAVVTDRATTDRVDITDHGVIYGPWLEGTGGRNHKSRFKGYHTFRRVRTQLNRRAQAIAEEHLARAVAKLNG